MVHIVLNFLVRVQPRFKVAEVQDQLPFAHMNEHCSRQWACWQTDKINAFDAAQS